MTKSRILPFAAAAAFAATVPASQVSAAELVFGSWTPAREYQNRVVMPEMFKIIEKETNGAIKWKLIAGRPACRRQDHLHRGEGRADAGRSRDRHLCAERHAVGLHDLLDRRSSAITIRSPPPARRWRRCIFNCPSCLEEVKKLNAVPLGGWTTSAYLLACKRAGEVARRPQGQARPRHRRQCRDVQDGGRGAGRRHAGRGGRPAAARRSRLPARHRRLAAHLRLRRLCQIRHGLSARPDRTGDRHVSQSRHLEQASRPSRRSLT